MAKLNADDIYALGQSLSDLAGTVEDWADDNWDDLTPSQRTKLTREYLDLNNAATRIKIQAGGMVIDEAQVDIKEVTQATDQANSAVAKIKAVGKAIDVAAAGITLAAAVITAPIAPSAVAVATAGLVSAVAE